MKTITKVFIIISMVVAILTLLACVPTAIFCFNPGEEILSQVYGQLSDKFTLEQVRFGFALLGFVFLFSSIYAIVNIVFCIVDLKRISKPITTKPIVLGVLSIFFVNIIVGILMLCLDEEGLEEDEPEMEAGGNNYYN